jgi:hypothetical protein
MELNNIQYQQTLIIRVENSPHENFSLQLNHEEYNFKRVCTVNQMSSLKDGNQYQQTGGNPIGEFSYRVLKGSIEPWKLYFSFV